MTRHHDTSSRRFGTMLMLAAGLGICSLAITAATIASLRSPATLQPAPPGDAAPASLETTISGTVGCLPHRDNTGPQTLECAIGLLGHDGKNYALDLQELDGRFVSTGTDVVLIGTLVPIEAISSDHWRRYDIAGILRVKIVAGE